MRTTLIAAGTIAALTLTSCAVPDDGKTSDAAPPAASGSGPASSGPTAKAKLTGTCDYDLGSGMGTDYTVSAEVVVKNTGTTPIRVKATARWPQFGHAPLSASGGVTYVPLCGTV